MAKVECPHCKELIDKNAWRCDHCRHAISEKIPIKNKKKTIKNDFAKPRVEIRSINQLIKKATKLQTEEDYFNAYSVWDDVVTEINQLLQRTKTARTLSKLSGWLVGFLTWGFGASDLIVIPAVNKLLMKLFGVDLDFIISRLSLAIRQRQACLNQSDKLVKVSVFKEELAYFAYSYTIENSVEKQTEKSIKKIFSLFNPFHKEKKLQFVKSEPELYEDILHIIENGRMTKEIRILNQYLKKYLEQKKKTKNILYNSLTIL